MKKLVKSAEQQFEERLNKLENIIKHELGENFSTFYSGNENGNFIMLYKSVYPDISIYIVDFEMPYTDLVNSEDFLSAMVNRYEESGKKIKPFFVWYANGCDLKENTHMIVDIWNTDLGEMYKIEDIYEEITDKVITAEQQFEEESKNAKEILPFLKVEQTSSNIIFYQNDKGDYYRFCYPSLEVMRKDKDFVFQMLKVMTNDFTKEDLATFMNWVDEGGEFPFPLSVIRSMEYYQDSSCYIYQDKEESLENLIKLTPEQQKAVDMIEEGVKLLRDNGGKLVCYSWADEWFVVNGNNLTYESTNEEKELERLKSNEFVDISVIADNQQISLDFDIYWATDGMLLARKNNNDYK